MRTCNYGYATLLSTLDYLPGVLVLNESLKRVQSVFPLVVGVTENIYTEKLVQILKSAGCFVEKIPLLSYSKTIQEKHPNHSVLNTASKVALFTLHWDKVVYIDADCMVLQNIDDLFHWPDGSMLYCKNSGGGFTALMVFCPAEHDYEIYKYCIENLIHFDGDLFQNLWYPVKTNAAYQIPEYYMQSFTEELEMQDANPDNWHEYKIIHFINNPKPWQYSLDNIHAAASCWYLYYYSTLLKEVRQKYSLDVS